MFSSLPEKESCLTYVHFYVGETSPGKQQGKIIKISMIVFPLTFAQQCILNTLALGYCVLPSSHALPANPIFYISNEIPTYNTTTQPHDLSPQTESGNATTSDLLTTKKAS
jgi:hypothetical protein